SLVLYPAELPVPTSFAFRVAGIEAINWAASPSTWGKRNQGLSAVNGLPARGQSVACWRICVSRRIRLTTDRTAQSQIAICPLARDFVASRGLDAIACYFGRC